jgi:hypothetical protein
MIKFKNIDVNSISAAYGIANLAWNVYNLLMKKEMEVEGLKETPWRPPQWGESAQVSLQDEKGTVYVFDAIFKTEHNSSIRTTEHPVQNEANITDHAFVLPEKVMIEVGMSDVMDAFIANQWESYGLKSVSAFQELKALQKARKPLTLTTRLHTYENMVIEQIHTPDDFKTLHGLRCTVALRQIISAGIRHVTVKASRIPHTTDATPKANVQGGEVPSLWSQLMTSVGVEK